MLAIEWYQKAVDQGHIDAMYCLATKYSNGDGIPENDALAIKIFTQAANLGDVESQFALGVLYEKGAGIKQDKSMAREWYEKAASQGHKKAMENLKRLKRKRFWPFG